MVYHKYFMIAMIKVLLMIRMKSCDDKNDDDADMTMLKLKIDQDFEIMCLMLVMMTVMMVVVVKISLGGPICLPASKKSNAG